VVLGDVTDVSEVHAAIYLISLNGDSVYDFLNLQIADVKINDQLVFT
jgi:hypothetical protein